MEEKKDTTLAIAPIENNTSFGSGSENAVMNNLSIKPIWYNP
jgi:hypothetical protein